MNVRHIKTRWHAGGGGGMLNVCRGGALKRWIT